MKQRKGKKNRGKNKKKIQVPVVNKKKNFTKKGSYFF